MKALISISLALATGACAQSMLGDPAASIAQAGVNSSVSHIADSAEARSERLQAAWDKAEASAPKPGDATLACNQIWAEQEKAVKDPTVVARLETIRTNAEKDAAGGAASFQLGATRAGVGVVIANLPQGQIINILTLAFQATFNIINANLAQSKAPALEADMTAIMPAYARAMHLGQLAQTKACPTPG